MTRPVRVRLSRAKGWRMPPDTVKVDHSTRWGNPWRVGEPDVRDAPAAGEDRRAHPRGKNLACWCALDAPCHADVLLKLANREDAA